MKPIDDLLKAFEVYYSTDKPLVYGAAQRIAIHNAYVWIGPEYRIALYDEVLRTHPASLRSLPDMAVISTATKQLNPPESYEPPKPLIEDMTGPTFDEVKASEEARAKRDGEANHYERQRIRDKVAKGTATVYEAWWIHCIDDNDDGRYTAMTPRFRERYEASTR
jgi:hypothetical protein